MGVKSLKVMDATMRQRMRNDSGVSCNLSGRAGGAASDIGGAPAGGSDCEAVGVAGAARAGGAASDIGGAPAGGSDCEAVGVAGAARAAAGGLAVTAAGAAGGVPDRLVGAADGADNEPLEDRLMTPTSAVGSTRYPRAERLERQARSALE
ncbi:hypothetical protein PF008_g1538 [Phytophthora fragariae]|uniref:Uncharacterized protein n=1 Tax=Phytophthora fragariae TaxID=53985 RepID=A0A6G0SJZ6_9STRA|nr:hypothetical protein PF008_g1538 [Phytophthora fragariae]